MKQKVTIVLAERQIRGLSQEAQTRFGVGISEFLRRALDDPGVQTAIAAMPRYEAPQVEPVALSPSQGIRRAARA